MENPFLGLYNCMLNIKENISELRQDIKELKMASNGSTSDNDVRYIDKRKAAKIGGVSVSTIDNWRRARKIIPYYFDTAVRFKYEEFIDFLESQKRIDDS